MSPGIILFAVTYVLMIAPVAMAVCKKLNTNPVPAMISISVSSNLQGAATLVGDTTAIMLGSALNMSFADFFWYLGKPSIFFAVELGAVLSCHHCLLHFQQRQSPRSARRCAAQMAPGLGAEASVVAVPLYFGLLSGATLGGNCTPIGASANIAGMGILRKEGYEVRNADFFKIGIPFTLVAIVPAYIYIWLIYGV